MRLLCDHETVVQVSHVILQCFTIIARFIDFNFLALPLVRYILDKGLFRLVTFLLQLLVFARLVLIH